MLRVLTCLLKLVFLFFSLKRTHGGSITLSSSTRTFEEMDRSVHFFSYLCDVLIFRALTTLNFNCQHMFETPILYCYENWCQIFIFLHTVNLPWTITRICCIKTWYHLSFFRDVVTLLVAVNKKCVDVSKVDGIASWF